MKDVRRNWDRVSDGFDVLHPVLVKFVVRKLADHYGEDAWWDKGVEPVLRDDQRRDFKGRTTDRERIYNNLDMALTLRVIDRSWNQVFRYELSRECHSWVMELQVVRNDFAHKGVEDCPSDDAYRSLDSMWRLCQEVDDDPDGRRAGRIRALMDEVLPSLATASEQRASAGTDGKKHAAPAGQAPASNAAQKRAKPSSGSGVQTRSAAQSATPSKAERGAKAETDAAAQVKTAKTGATANSAKAPTSAPAKTAAGAKAVASTPARPASSTQAARSKGTAAQSQAKPAAGSGSASRFAAKPAFKNVPKSFNAYKQADVDFNYSSSAEPNVDFVREVLRVEVPVHRDVVVRRMGQHMHRNAADRVVKHDANEALNKLLAESSAYRRDGGFVYPSIEAAGAKLPRRAGDRTWNEIPPEELEAGLLVVLRSEWYSNQ